MAKKKLRKSETGLWDLAESEDCSHRVHIAGKQRAEEWIEPNVDNESLAVALTETRLALIILTYGITSAQLEEARTHGKTIAIPAD